MPFKFSDLYNQPVSPMKMQACGDPEATTGAILVGDLMLCSRMSRQTYEPQDSCRACVEETDERMRLCGIHCWA